LTPRGTYPCPRVGPEPRVGGLVARKPIARRRRWEAVHLRQRRPHSPLAHRNRGSGSHPRGQVRRDAYEGAHLSVVGYQGGSGGQEPTTDPCTLDQRLVCLGLLFGLGEFADTGAEVLGDVLANTGVGVIGLTVLTAMLLIAGSAALAASSRRLRVVTRTG